MAGKKKNGGAAAVAVPDSAPSKVVPASKVATGESAKGPPIAGFIDGVKLSLNRLKDGLTPSDTWQLVQLAALIALAYMIVPQLWWMATTAFPNWIATAQNRFLDRGQPIMVQVYKDWCPTVLNVPIFERLEWYLVRLPAFMGRMLTQFPVALVSALYSGYKTIPVADQEWTEVWTDNWLSEFMESRAPGAIDWLPSAAEPDFYYFEAQFDIMGGDAAGPTGQIFPGWDYDENCYGAGTRVAFRRSKQGGVLETLAIRMHHTTFLPKPLIVRPTDKAWNAAKTFVLHGANHRLVLAFHPMRHFPLDTVNGITKNMEFLPHYHVLRQLLMPHFKLTLPLEDAVMNSWFLSILLNPYFLHPFDTNKGWAILNYAVWEFSYYNFSTSQLKLEPADQPSGRSVFLQAYHQPLRDFVSAAVYDKRNLQSFRDSHVRDWGNEIARHVPGWPSGDELAENTELLVDTLTTVMFDLSFEHAVQHWQYAHVINNRMKPWRVHHRPPQSVDEDWDYEKGTQTFTEYIIHFVTNNVFFFFGPYSKIQDIDYGFTGDLKMAQINMTNAWKAYNQQRKDFPEIFPGYLVPLEEIGPAIDY